MTGHDTRGPFRHDDTCPDQPSGRLTAACDCGQREAVEKLMAASSGHDTRRDQIADEQQLVDQLRRVLHDGQPYQGEALVAAVMAVIRPLLAAVAEARAETAEAIAQDDRSITHVVPIDGVDHEPVRCPCGPTIYEDAAAHTEFGMPPEVAAAEDDALTFVHNPMGETTGRWEIRAEEGAAFDIARKHGKDQP